MLQQKLDEADDRAPLRVCVVTENFLPKIDGVTRTLARLLDHLRDQGHEALIVGPDNGLTTYAGFSVRGTFGLPLFFYPELKWNFLSPSTLSRIIEFKPDVLHFVDPILLGPQVLLAAMFYLPHVPRVSSYHTNIALYAKHFGYPLLSPVIWKLQRYLHGHCAAIMCPSPSTATALTEHHFPEDKIRIWHRGVDTDLFSPAKRRKELRQLWLGPTDEAAVLLYVGRVSWEKNLKVLLEAYVHLHATRKDIHLVITGDGPARTELETIFHDAKVPVTFTGYLQGEELAACYASCDIFTFPSKSETFGQVVLEAQASALPVVAFQAEGVCDIIQDGITGWLAPVALRQTDESANFERAVAGAVDDPTRRVNASVDARRWAMSWRWSEAMEKCVDTYREAIR